MFNKQHTPPLIARDSFERKQTTIFAVSGRAHVKRRNERSGVRQLRRAAPKIMFEYVWETFVAVNNLEPELSSSSWADAIDSTANVVGFTG